MPLIDCCDCMSAIYSYNECYFVYSLVHVCLNQQILSYVDEFEVFGMNAIFVFKFGILLYVYFCFCTTLTF